MLFIIGRGGKMAIYLWKQNDLTDYAVSIERDAPTTKWSGLSWEFDITSVSSNLQIKRFAKLAFDDSFQLPSTPPSVDYLFGTQ